jgi:hypothetical protein
MLSTLLYWSELIWSAWNNARAITDKGNYLDAIAVSEQQRNSDKGEPKVARERISQSVFSVLRISFEQVNRYTRDK